MRFRDRRNRKRDFRRLWITRINAAARLNGLTYSSLVHGLKLANVQVDRKVLADIAARDAATFGKIADTGQVPAQPSVVRSVRSESHTRTFGRQRQGFRSLPLLFLTHSHAQSPVPTTHVSIGPQTPRAREQTGLCLLEGMRLVKDALSAGARFDSVFVDRRLVEQAEQIPLLTTLQQAGVPLFVVDAALLESMSETVTPQGIVALTHLPAPVIPANPWLVLVLDGVGIQATQARSCAVQSQPVWSWSSLGQGLWMLWACQSAAGGDGRTFLHGAAQLRDMGRGR